MAIAKLTSFFGGFIYAIFFAALLFFGKAASEILANFQVTSRTLFALILALLFLVSVINFCYGVFVSIRDRYHENLEGAFFYSLQLLVTPILIFIGIIVAFISFQ
ncbi:MAG TPA: hypothetical protein VLE47_00830 [Candidatus Saccharimonadales bacterium]|nr:hypothetical protein [Candidatus Saccharimonadales bacterium]